MDVEPSSKLRLGIPKGSLEAATIELFKQAGWTVTPRSRNYFPSINDPEIECALVRSQEMGPYVAETNLDAGLCGIDWLMETQTLDDLEIISDLFYSKASDKKARWVLVVDAKSPIQSVGDLEGKTIATELVDYTKRYLKERGINAKVEFSWGATEAKVVEGMADAAVEITETGSTIRAHGLRIVCDLLETHTVFFANKKAMADNWKRSKIDQIALLIQAALDARQKVLLKMNVGEKNLDSVVGLLPSLHAPTVNRLAETGWSAVETVVDTHAVRALIPRLKAAGAEGILELDLKKIC